MKRMLFLIVFVCAASAPAASGSVVLYTDRAAWEAAAHPTVVLEFEGIAPVGGLADFPAGFTQDGVTIASGDGPTRIADEGLGTFISGWGTGDMIFGIGLFAPGSITFGAPVFAFGFNYGATACFFIDCGPDSTGIHLNIPGLADFSVTGGPMPPFAFIGVISDVPITSATFTINPSFGVVDRFAFASAVPEPATLALLGLGLAGLGVARRRKLNLIATSGALHPRSRRR